MVNNSLMHFALIDTFVSYFSESYGRLFTQDLDWNWSEDFLRVMIVTGVHLVATSPLQS